MIKQNENKQLSINIISKYNILYKIYNIENFYFKENEFCIMKKKLL